MSPTPTTPAPWRPFFQTHISKLPSPEFVLSTVHAVSSSQGGTPTYLPRARYCVTRGFWTELPENKLNTAPQNPRLYESDCLTFTTDARMEKYQDLKGEKGGPVEAVYWVKDVMTQWRIRGRGYVVGGPEGKEEDLVRKEVESRMRRVEGRNGEWNWETEITAHFGNCNPGMRGSFKNPPPGVPVSKPLSDPSLVLGQKVEDIHDSVARKNFRVVIICPEEVEQVDLTDPSEARRWKWTFSGDGGEVDEKRDEGTEVVGGWRMEELWP